MKRWALGMVAVIALELFLVGAELTSQTSGLFALFRAAAAVEAPLSYVPRLDGFAAELEEANACYEIEGGDCAFPRTTPDSYRVAVGQNLRATLLELRDWSVRNAIRDVRVSYLAIPYLRSGDPDVQEAALAVLRSQPARAECLDAILGRISAGISGPLEKEARAELGRYQSPADRAKIELALKH